MKNYEDMSKREQRVHNQLTRELYVDEKLAFWGTVIVSVLKVFIVIVEPLYLPFFVISLVFAWAGYLIASRLNSYVGEGIGVLFSLFAGRLLTVIYFILMITRYRRNKYVLKLQSEQ